MEALALAPEDNTGPVKAAPISIAEYQAKYEAAVVSAAHMSVIESICQRMKSAQARYLTVSGAVGCPWWVVACIHEKEASLNFATYLQCGDPLFDHHGHPVATFHVPRGIGPFKPQTWENAAIHALGGVGAHLGSSQSVGFWLAFCEAYNGLGYRRRGVPSPYLWSYTNQYVKGHYVADGVYDSNGVDKNPGVAALAKVLGVS